MKKSISHLTIWFSLLICMNGFAEEKKQLHHLSPPPKKGRFEITKTDWPKKYAEAAVCLWKGAKTAALSITMDVPGDHAWWLEQGRKYKMNFTWFIVTGKVKKERGRNFFGSWPLFADILKAGHDVQSHTVEHRSKKQKKPLTCEEEYRGSRDALNENLQGNRALAIAYPGGGYPNDYDEAMKHYIAARGARGMLNIPNKTDYTCTGSISGRLILDPEYRVNIPATMTPGHRYYRAWYCSHFHGVNDETKKKIIKALKYINKNRQSIWIGKFLEVAQYGQERDTAVVKTVKASSKTITLSLTDDMDDKLFDYPLTLKVKLDKEWKSIKAKQENKEIPAKIIEHEGSTYAMLEAVPDKGEIVLTK